MNDLNLRRLIPLATLGALAAASCAGTTRSEDDEEIDREKVAESPRAFDQAADSLVTDICQKAASCESDGSYSVDDCVYYYDYAVDEYFDTSTPECRVALVDALDCLAKNLSCRDEDAAYYACEAQMEDLYYQGCYYEYDDYGTSGPVELPEDMGVGGASPQ